MKGPRMPKTYRVAVIGRTGRGNYGHGLDVVWKGLDNIEIVAVADSDDKGRAAAAKRLGAKNVYADYRTMLEKEKPNIVSVAVRHLDPHRDMVIACANAGASIFLEKPMARTLAEADEMIKACEMHHVKLAIAHQTRYSPRLHRVRELITSGRLRRPAGTARPGEGRQSRRRRGHDGAGNAPLRSDAPAGWRSILVLRPRAASRQTGDEGAGPSRRRGHGADCGVIRSTPFTALPKAWWERSARIGARHGAGQRFGLSVYGTRGIVQMGTGSLPPVWFLDDPSWTPAKSKAA